MSHQYSLSATRGMQTRGWRRNQNRIRFTPGKGFGPVAHTVMIALMLSVLGLIYLTQITKTGAFGYQINELEVRKEQLLSEKRDLEVESARLQALERVKQSDVAQAMTAPAETTYVNAN